MISADFDVKFKLIILFGVALIVLASVLGTLWHRSHHFEARYLTGVVAVMVVMVAILSSLFMIHQ